MVGSNRGILPIRTKTAFLYIEGRLSRFSKIGGEMVPHETVEAKIIEAFDLRMEDERLIAVIGIPDESKGEALIMLTVRDLKPAEIREKLWRKAYQACGSPRMSNGWKKFRSSVQVSLDLGACQALADPRRSHRQAVSREAGLGSNQNIGNTLGSRQRYGRC